MQSTESNRWLNYSRNLYQRLLPEPLRNRLHHSPFLQSILPGRSEEQIPYVLLTERHIANLQVVLNRNALLAALPQDAIVAEIGVAQGDFSKRILQYANPRKLHLIDVWDSERYHSGLQQVVADKLGGEIDSGRVQINFGYSTDVLPKFEDHYFDWVYIDTDHTYKTTRRELEICAKKVKPGGIIAGHDYITGDWKMHNRYGVVEAVNEFCVTHGWELVFTTYETHRHLSYAIREIPK